MTEFNFNTSYYFSSLENLNSECKNYTNSEARYQELRTKYENEIYNKALDEIEYNLLRNIDHKYFYPTSDFRYAIYDLVRDALYDTIEELTKEV